MNTACDLKSLTSSENEVGPSKGNGSVCPLPRPKREDRAHIRISVGGDGIPSAVQANTNLGDDYAPRCRPTVPARVTTRKGSEEHVMSMLDGSPLVHLATYEDLNGTRREPMPGFRADGERSSLGRVQSLSASSPTSSSVDELPAEPQQTGDTQREGDDAESDEAARAALISGTALQKPVFHRSAPAGSDGAASSAICDRSAL